MTVPSLIGLNLSDTGGVVVGWVTFGLGLVAALSTAMLALFHFRDRWFLYRTLQDQLLAAAWGLINRPAPTAADWAVFVKATESAIARYNAAYDSEVIPVTSPPGGLNPPRPFPGRQRSGTGRVMPARPGGSHPLWTMTWGAESVAMAAW